MSISFYPWEFCYNVTIECKENILERDLSGLEMVGMEKGIAQQFRVNTFNLIAE